MGQKKIFDNIPLMARFKNWCYACLNVVQSLENNNEKRVIINQLTSDLQDECTELLKIMEISENNS